MSQWGRWKRLGDWREAQQAETGTKLGELGAGSHVAGSFLPASKPRGPGEASGAPGLLCVFGGTKPGCLTRPTGWKTRRLEAGTPGKREDTGQEKGLGPRAGSLLLLAPHTFCPEEERLSVSAPRVHFPFQRFSDHPPGSCRQSLHNPIQDSLRPWEASLCPSNCISSLGQRKAESRPFPKEFHSKPSVKPLLGQAHAWS